MNPDHSENVKWPFSLSHNRMQDGGWARQQSGMYPLYSLGVTLNVSCRVERDVPIATAMAGVDMRLNAGAIRCVN